MKINTIFHSKNIFILDQKDEIDPKIGPSRELNRGPQKKRCQAPYELRYFSPKGV